MGQVEREETDRQGWVLSTQEKRGKMRKWLTRNQKKESKVSEIYNQICLNLDRFSSGFFPLLAFTNTLLVFLLQG